MSFRDLPPASAALGGFTVGAGLVAVLVLLAACAAPDLVQVGPPRQLLPAAEVAAIEAMAAGRAGQ